MPDGVFFPRVLEAAKLVTRPGGGILHCGAGDGSVVVELLSAGIDARGIDVSYAGTALASGRFVRGGQCALPFRDSQFATLIASPGWLESLDEEQLDAALAELARVARDAIVIATTGRPFERDASETPRPRDWWEQRLFSHGLRRHTCFFAGTSSFEVLEHETGACIVMQLLPGDAARVHPLTTLAPERDLHMDMLRESGRRSDAHLARYEWARDWIRPGDVVVDAACGLGYGTAMLWDGTEAARVVGLDICERAIRYARDCYGPGRPGVEFLLHDAQDWSEWPDNSVDCVVSFETIEHLADPQRFIEGVRRVLRPGGRILCSVPNEWMDHTGTDPNPWHLQVFTLDRLVELVSEGLLVDEVYAQSAGGHDARFHPSRQLRNTGWPSTDTGLIAGAEWLLLTAVKDPVAGSHVPYVERVFPADARPAPDAIAFARDYVNPWAVHSVVMGSYRVRSPRLLTTLARRWLSQSPQGSADRGAALCVLAYAHLSRASSDEAAQLLAEIRTYIEGEVASPQGRRWQISLLYAEGLLRLRRGELSLAERRFRQCACQDASAVTPHLETKTTSAAWLAGRLALEHGDASGATADWTSGFQALDRMRQKSISAWLVTPRRPAAFEAGDGLREIAIAVDNAAVCANAIRAAADPSGAWRPMRRGIERNFQRAIDALIRESHEGWHSASHAWEQARIAEAGAARARDELRLALARQHVLGGKHDGGPLRMPGHAVRVGVFGTGAGALVVAGALARIDSVRLVWFADNDAARQGGTLLWLDIIAPQEIPARECDVVVIGSMSVAPIREQLVALGIPAHRLLAPDVTAAPDAVLAELNALLSNLHDLAGVGTRA